MGVPLHPQAIGRRVSALKTVNFYALLLPSAFLGIVLSYTHTHIQLAGSHTHSVVAGAGHVLFSLCRVTCFPLNKPTFLYVAQAQLHGCFFVLSSHSTLFVLVFFFHVTIFAIEESWTTDPVSLLTHTHTFPCFPFTRGVWRQAGAELAPALLCVVERGKLWALTIWTKWQH